MLKPAFLLLSTALLAACQSAPGTATPRGAAAYADDARLGEKVSSICFSSNIDGFSMNERDTVVLREGRDEYLVEVLGTCLDLESALAIGIDSTTSCLSKGDNLIVSSSLTGSNVGIGPQRCMIREIYAWNPDAEDTPEEAAPAE